MPTRLDDLLDRRARYLAAEVKILESQQYTVGDGVIQRSNRRADLEQVRAQIKELDDLIDRERNRSAGGRRVYRGVPGGC